MFRPPRQRIGTSSVTQLSTMVNFPIRAPSVWRTQTATDRAGALQARTDDMLKVHGMWVSPGWRKTPFWITPAVMECAVVGAMDNDGLERPKAFQGPESTTSLVCRTGGGGAEVRSGQAGQV